MRLLITAGPTREPIDPVRYLSNRSTGAMGLALAARALEHGHEVVLVLGPVERPVPAGADVVRVETAREMLEEVLRRLPEADAVVCAAAVSDYRPAERSARKLKRGGPGPNMLALEENPDIAAEVGRRRGTRKLVIFALETEDAEHHARAKLERKNADLCVLNDPDAVGATHAHFALLHRDGTRRDLGLVSKDSLADVLLGEVVPTRD